MVLHPQGEQITKILNIIKNGPKYDVGKYAIWLDGISAQYGDCAINQSYVPYWFYMKNTIQSKQWTMNFKDLVVMCEESGSKMVYMNNLRCVYEKEIMNTKNQGVMERMGMRDTLLEEIDLKNISMYCMFVFAKPSK